MVEELSNTREPWRPVASAVTIDDVAAAARVSPATVSRVINNRPVVAAGTRGRVLDAIERLNFRPSALGRGLATRRTGTLGLVIADITNPFYPEIVRGVEQAAAAHGMSLLLYDTAEESDREAEALRLLGERTVDGVIICASRLPEERLTTLAAADTPLVFINRRPAVWSIGAVDVDQEAGVHAAVDHLAALGHRRITYIGGPEASQVQQRRRAAFQAACAAHGITISDSSIVTANPTIAGGQDVGRRLLRAASSRCTSGSSRPTAVLAYNDLIAVGLLMVAQANGIAIPAHLSVVGHDDIPLSAALHPALTTVRQPMRDLGRRAVRLLHTHLQHHRRDGTRDAPSLVRLAPTLIVRASTGPVRR